MNPIRLFAVVALLASGTVLFSNPVYGYMATDYANAGQQFYNAKNYDQAIRYFNAALQMDPNNASALQGRADCYYAQGQYQQSLSDYQHAQSLQPSPQLASFIQTLQIKLGMNSPQAPPAGDTLPGIPAEPSLPPDLPTPAGKPANPSPEKMELVLGLGGAPIVNGVEAGDVIVNPASLYPYGGSGGEQIGYGGEAGFYFLIDPRFYAGVDLENYFYRTGITDLLNRNNLVLLGSAKWFLGGTDTKPYLEGGLGCTYMTLSGVFNADYYPSTYSSGTTITQVMPAVSFLCPIAQIGLGLEVSIGQGTDFFFEAKSRILFFGTYQQTVTPGSFTLTRYYGTSFGNPVIDVPLAAGLAFHL